MATTQQIDANRQNAQKSTGPRTLEGKAASRFNALKSGIDAQAEIIPTEDPASLEVLVAEYQERWSTHTPERRMLVDTLVNAEWMLRRLRRGEGDMWGHLEELTLTPTKFREGRVLYNWETIYDRLQRRINSVQRNYLHALKELQNLEKTEAAETAETQVEQVVRVEEVDQVGQALPPANPVPASAPLQSTSNQQLAQRIGFVPQSSEIRPQPAPEARLNVARSTPEAA